ncbi:Proteintyrosine phosphatase [Balamuthia mandrillaris]
MEEAKLQSEFEQLALQEQRKAKPDFNFALEYHNIHKNRYGNVLPNPETRVKLQGGRSSDYINANYVKGESQVYIACQAPLPNTFADFWRMIWEQHSYVIMMLTRLMEKERVKAEKYWPTRGPLSRTRRPGTAESESGGEGGWKQYGSIAVRLERQHQHSAKIIVREFSLRHDSSAEEQGLVDLTDLEERQEQEIRRVVQIHYTGWPDFGRPKSTKTFKKLLGLMEQHRQAAPEGLNGPIVLHCSAGLGRTGTLIAAHIALEKLRLKKVEKREELDMKQIVEELREQRRGMVQTKEQYLFLHELVRAYSSLSLYV